MFFTCSFITKKRGFDKLYNNYLKKLKVKLLTKEIKEKKSLNPVADRVEKRTKEISVKSEKLVSEGLNFLENFILKLLEIRPREYKPHDYRTREFRKKESGDEE